MNQFTKGLITLTYCHYPFSLKFHSLDDNLFKKVKSKMKKSILALSVLPCADCEGIETELKLNLDKTYEIKETYLGKGDGKAFESKGSFQFDSKNSSIIALDKAGDNRKYFVAEGHLKALDLEGNQITGALADKYQLKKEVK